MRKKIFDSLRKINQVTHEFGEEISAKYKRFREMETSDENSEKNVRSAGLIIEQKFDDEQPILISKLIADDEKISGNISQTNKNMDVLRHQTTIKMSLNDELLFERNAIRNKHFFNPEKKKAIDDQCLGWILKYCYDWKKDLNARPKSAAVSSLGRRAYNDYRKTMKAFGYLFEQLQTGTLKTEIKNGILPMILAMKEKNYKKANTILLNSIAIGNAPWPIGVTQVGIHTKSAARERISTTHKNKTAAAHVMGDEATRKYLHALKRLLTITQRLYPTDPSCCIDFHDEVDLAKGICGAGSIKRALMNKNNFQNELQK